MIGKVPLSQKFAQTGIMPLKFGQIAKKCKEIENTMVEFEPALIWNMHISQRLEPLSQPTLIKMDGLLLDKVQL